jgi:hypothetical protein
LAPVKCQERAKVVVLGGIQGRFCITSSKK